MGISRKAVENLDEGVAKRFDGLARGKASKPSQCSVCGGTERITPRLSRKPSPSTAASFKIVSASRLDRRCTACVSVFRNVPSLSVFLWSTSLDGVSSLDGASSPDGVSSLDGASSPDGVSSLDGVSSPDGASSPDGVPSPDGVSSLMLHHSAETGYRHKSDFQQRTENQKARTE